MTKQQQKKPKPRKAKPSSGLTPRPYLSWSSMSLFENDEERWVRHYIEGQTLPINRGMALGKLLAESLEHDKLSGDPMLDIVAAQLPKLDTPEAELTTSFTHKGLTVPLLIKVDTAAKTWEAFIEYKSGPAGNWNQKKAEDGQTLFYSTAIWCATKKIPTGTLAHAITQYDENGRPAFTGEIKPYHFQHTLADILKMQLRMAKAWEGIIRVTQEHLL